MSGTEQNPYPKCIKCNVELSPRDSRGWEKIIDNSDCINNPEGSAKELWLCPNCIYGFEATKDLVEIQIKKANKIWRLLADFKYLLDEADRIDSPANDYPDAVGSKNK